MRTAIEDVLYRWPVRLSTATIFEVTFDRSDVVVVEPFAVHVNQLAERRELHRFQQGYAVGNARLTINSKQFNYIRKKQVSVIQYNDIEADEDGNEVAVWDLAPYSIANRFQFHQTNHRGEDTEDCRCGVLVTKAGDEGEAIEWVVAM